MENNTAELLTKLSEKLGTTSEYLWGVLIKQAPIESVISLAQTLFILSTTFFLYHKHKKYSNDENKISYYEIDSLAPIMITAACVNFILLIACFCCIGDIVNGFLNPEYWALNKILENLNQ